MEDVIRERERERRRVVERAKAYVSSLEGKLSAFLIGSYARGDFNAWSDVDLLVVGDFRGNPLERLMEMDFPPGFEVIPLTEGEFRSAIERNNPVIWDVKDRGVVLRDDLNLCGKYPEIRCREGVR